MLIRARNITEINMLPIFLLCIFFIPCASENNFSLITSSGHNMKISTPRNGANEATKISHRFDSKERLLLFLVILEKMSVCIIFGYCCIQCRGSAKRKPWGRRREYGKRMDGITYLKVPAGSGSIWFEDEQNMRSRAHSSTSGHIHKQMINTARFTRMRSISA